MSLQHPSQESELCDHGRLTTAFCEPCSEIEVGIENALIDELSYAQEVLESREYKAPGGPFELEKPARKISQKVVQPNGSDAPYYDFPEGIKTAMDLIEWLSLDFSNGNVLKSLIRENNPNGAKETTTSYEAEKRVYYATRHLRRVQALQE